MSEHRKLRFESLEQRSLLAANQIAVIGDYGHDSKGEAAVADLIRSWSVSDVITTGDNDYEGNYDQSVGKYYHEYIGNYQGSHGEGSSQNHFWPSLGNHDYEDDPTAARYRQFFTLPGNERYYDVVLGDVHLFVINSEPQEPDGKTATSDQGDWLKIALEASTSRYNVVVGHRPPYSSSKTHGSSPYMQWPYKEWGADLQLSGHDHTYERLNVGGLTYVVNGLGGLSSPPGYPFGTPLAGSQVRYNATSGALRLTVTSSGMTGEFFSIAEPGGQLIDTFTIPPHSGGGSETPRLSIADQARAEGNSGSSPLVFNVTLSAASTSPVTVHYATANGSATTSNDYEAASGNLTFAPGVTARSLTVPVKGDTAVEPHETFFVNLSAASGATLDDANATGTITNDDGGGSGSGTSKVAVKDAKVKEGNSGLTDLVVRIALSAATSQVVTANWHTADYTAQAGSDYVAGSGTVTFQPGQTLQTITVAVKGDTLLESDERLQVYLESPVGATIGDARATARILNDDKAAAAIAQGVAFDETVAVIAKERQRRA